MKNNLKLWGLGILASVMLAACGPAAHIEKDNAANFNAYKSFAWAQDTARKADLTQQRVKDAVTKELNDIGWKETSRNPDVILSYDLLVERGSRVQNDPVYSNSFSRIFYSPATRRYYSVYYPSQFIGYDRYEVPVTEGTITITMTDEKTGRQVMQGWATEQLDERKMSVMEVDRVVKAIFKKFDVAAK